MNLQTFQLSLAVWLLVLSSPSVALTASASIANHPKSVFYSQSAEGWYWYQDPICPEEKPKPDVATEAPKKEKRLAKGPEPFTLAWVQEMLPKYRELAWNNPSQTNVQAYFLIQRFAMDKANQFADMAQQVVVGNVLLDETMRRPLATFANMQVDRVAANNADDLLRKVAQKAGIFFFFKSDCRYCEAQAPLLAHLQGLGFNVLAVSLDGGELQTQKFPDTRIDSGQAHALGVTATPAMFLMNEQGQFTALGQTVLSYSELRRRILLVAAREGWISQDDLKQTQPYLNPSQQHDLGQELPKLLKASQDNPINLFGRADQMAVVSGLTAQDKTQLIDEKNFISPDKLVALFGKTAVTTSKLAKDEDEHELP